MKEDTTINPIYVNILRKEYKDSFITHTDYTSRENNYQNIVRYLLEAYNLSNISQDDIISLVDFAVIDYPDIEDIRTYIDNIGQHYKDEFFMKFSIINYFKERRLIEDLTYNHLRFIIAKFLEYYKEDCINKTALANFRGENLPPPIKQLMEKKCWQNFFTYSREFILNDTLKTLIYNIIFSINNKH